MVFVSFLEVFQTPFFPVFGGFGDLGGWRYLVCPLRGCWSLLVVLAVLG